MLLLLVLTVAAIVAADQKGKREELDQTIFDTGRREREHNDYDKGKREQDEDDDGRKREVFEGDIIPN